MNPSFEDLVAQYHKLVLSLIHRYYGGRLSHKADDLAQDVWTKLWEQFKKNENNVVNFKSYLYRTVQTTMWDAVRALEKEGTQDPIEDHAELGRQEDEPRLLDRMQLERFLGQLKSDDARMIRAYIKGFNNQEIAVLLGCSEGRVRNLISRIKKKLAAMGGT